MTDRIIGAAIEVHRELGPALLESAYEECFCHELAERGLKLRRQAPLPVVYKEIRLDCGYRVDVIVEDAVVVELKAVERILPVHHAQLLTYLKLTGMRVGLLFNFASETIRHAFVRRVL